MTTVITTSSVVRYVNIQWVECKQKWVFTRGSNIYPKRGYLSVFKKKKIVLFSPYSSPQNEYARVIIQNIKHLGESGVITDP